MSSHPYPVPPPELKHVLAIDTCGPSGSVALGRLSSEPGSLGILGEVPLEGRTYSATLVAAVVTLLREHQIRMKEIACIVAVGGPGSFTGVRVGLSAAKGLAEPGATPILAVSRLEALAFVAGVRSAALDAHRHEVFLRYEDARGAIREVLAGQTELRELSAPSMIAVCDAGAAGLLSAAWPESRFIQVAAPSASDALRLAVPRIRSADFADPALLDGHYLRRSDAEIFGPPASCA